MGKLTRAGRLRAAFDYQDLVAIEFLIRFYRDPTLYRWIAIDTDDPAVASVDDVVMCSPDGKLELIQVKFAVDPESPATRLDWKWLLEQESGRKSWIRKWAATVLGHADSGQLGNAKLVTNRIPDADFGASLIGNTHVDFGNLPEDLRTCIAAQIGSESEAELFFREFEFDHSRPRIPGFEASLRSRIPAIDTFGWLGLRDCVKEWAIRADWPKPGSRIHHIDIEQAFERNRFKPLRQEFKVPPEFQAPSEEFEQRFLRSVSSSDGVTILQGPPGRGKSTFLSYCVQRLRAKGSFCIRHHYDLGPGDHSTGRFDFGEIERSLIHQLNAGEAGGTAAREDLRSRIEASALRLHAEHKRLVIVIDGLDHVWREGESRTDLNALFKALLPLPPNASLVIGTQPIAAAQLPSRLVGASPIPDRVELPSMTPQSVAGWLRHQVASVELEFEIAEGESGDEALDGLASALHDVSGGSPLHLIYSCQAAIESSGTLSRNSIKGLPECPGGEIDRYYEVLWHQIGSTARTILHVLAGLEFGPPPMLLAECFGGDDSARSAVSEIKHLLDLRGLQSRPFHGSLFAFVQAMPDQDREFQDHAPLITNWLCERAPAFWRWAWLWITQSQLGDKAPLIDGSSRDWAIESIANGYPAEQIATILDHAERQAFDGFDLPRLIELRALKARVLTGPEHQSERWDLFCETAISLTSDIDYAKSLFSKFDERDLESLVLAASRVSASVVDRLIEPIVARLNDPEPEESESVFFSPSQEMAPVSALAGVLARMPNGANRDEMELLQPYVEDYGVPADFARRAISVAQYQNVIAASERWEDPALDRELLAALCLEGLSPHREPGLQGRLHPAIACLAAVLDADAEYFASVESLAAETPFATYRLNYHRELSRDAVYECFFWSLATELIRDAEFGFSPLLPDWVDHLPASIVGGLQRLARAIADSWIQERRWPTLGSFLEQLESELPPPTLDLHWNSLILIRLALTDVAIDIATIGVGIDANCRILDSDIERASESPYWHPFSWANAFADRRLPLHTQSAAGRFLEIAIEQLDSQVTPFNERTDELTALAAFALDNNLAQRSAELLRRSAACFLGYGAYRDQLAHEVYRSLSHLASDGDDECLRRLIELSGEFECEDNYSDSELPVLLDYFALVGEQLPDRAALCYRHLIEQEQWSCAEALLSSFVKAHCQDSDACRALIESSVSHTELLGFKRLATDPKLRLRIDLQLRRFGHESEASASANLESNESVGHGEPPRSNDTVGADGPNPIDPRLFAPGQIEEYLAAGEGPDWESPDNDPAANWLEYWANRGRTEAALRDFESHLDRFNSRSVSVNSYKMAYQISLDHQGRSRAFDWLVREHIEYFGWHWYHSRSSDWHSRVQAVANNHLGNWEEFIRRTIKPRFPDVADRNGLTVGYSSLVEFLARTGQSEQARACAIALASVFESELEEQPIPRPAWAN